jgi:hypothetical protein
MQRHKNSLPASIIEAIGQVKKGAEVMMLSAELMHNQIISLERANEAATRRRQCKKKWIQRYVWSVVGYQGAMRSLIPVQLEGLRANAAKSTTGG